MMKKIIVSEHITLDGFVAGPNGEMDWIKLDDTLFDLVNQFTNEADVALYGRITYGMMESYWPTAAEQPGATKHDVEHSRWYNQAKKVVVSTTMNDETKEKLSVVKNNIAATIKELKKQNGKNIMVFGSPRVVHLLAENNLVDEYWLFINPVILGEGIPMFPKLLQRSALKLADSIRFDCGVNALHYEVM